jgi:hypothetical protein
MVISLRSLNVEELKAWSSINSKFDEMMLIVDKLYERFASHSVGIFLLLN